MRELVFGTEIQWLVDAGVFKGCNPPDNNRFCPDRFATRGQMAAFLERARSTCRQASPVQ